MSSLTKQQKKWFDKLQRVLNECPFDTSDFDSFTIGDNDITVFVNKREVDKHSTSSGQDLCLSVEALDAEVYRLIFPFTVASSCG